MFYKSRVEPKELIVFELLSKRMDLTSKENGYYFSLKKGFEGEVLFDYSLEKLRCECIILSDLLLEVNNTIFQIDSLVITPAKAFVYEVKNFEGDYYYESSKFHKRPSLEIVNPLNQLSRAESLLRQLFLRLKINLPVESSVVFINPHFTLYQAPMNKSLIFPSQINQLVDNLNLISTKITNHHKAIADKLMAQHIANSPYSKIPEYRYDMLRKGISCRKCHSFSVYFEGKMCICKECGDMELVSNALLRTVEEFRTLFPSEKITTNTIYNWCGGALTKGRIGRILSKNFTIVGDRRWAYFE